MRGLHKDAQPLILSRPPPILAGTHMRVSILGPGAVGGLLGGLAAAAGHTVTFLTRPAAGRTASSLDLRVGYPGGWVSLQGMSRSPWTSAFPAGEEPDLLVVCLGRQHTRELKAGALAPLVRGDTIVAWCNAEGGEAERLGIPAGRVSPCVTLFQAVSLQEGDVDLVSDPAVLVVEGGSRPEEAFRSFSRWGVRIQPVKDAVPHRNALFVYELLFLPAALCNTTVEHFLSFPEGRQIARMVLEEGLETMARTGRLLARLPVMDPAELAVRLRRSWRGAERHLPDRSYPPLLSSYLRGRPGEARDLNKRIVEMAAEAGMHLVWNWQLFQKASRPATVGFYRDPAEMLGSLA
jgi:ketopantoate reductase